MRAEEIQPGDQLRDTEGRRIYEVAEVLTRPPHIIARVHYEDGGDAERMWEIGAEVPLIHP